MIIAGYILLGVSVTIMALCLFSNLFLSLAPALTLVAVLIVFFILPGIAFLILGYIFKRKRVARQAAAKNIQYFCPNCSKEVLKDYVCCPHCGTKIDCEAQKEKFCIECGKELKEEHTFCPYCGKKR